MEDDAVVVAAQELCVTVSASPRWYHGPRCLLTFAAVSEDVSSYMDPDCLRPHCDGMDDLQLCWIGC